MCVGVSRLSATLVPPLTEDHRGWRMEAEAAGDLSYFCPADRSAKSYVFNSEGKTLAVVCFDAFDSRAKIKADANQRK